MKKIIILNKKEGETPLEALEDFRRKNKKYKNVKMTYAGRLDPMASGLLLVLAGEEVKKKEKYLKLSKEYDFEILFGFSTDTHDILGKVYHSNILTNVGMNLSKKKLVKLIRSNLKNFQGEFTQDYPMYSSKTVKGKPLFQYARTGEGIDISNRKIYVKSLTFVKIKKITPKNLLRNIEKRIKKIKGDFRQEEILKIWKKKLNKKTIPLFTANFKIKCGGGTYVRGIAHSLGKKIGVPALAFSIKRIKVGNYAKEG